jgi:hypothetical protein
MAEVEQDQPTEITTDQRRIATRMVLHLIGKSCGAESANYWAWERTPMPTGWPSDEQLLDGLKMAARGTKPGPWKMPKGAPMAGASPK